RGAFLAEHRGGGGDDRSENERHEQWRLHQQSRKGHRSWPEPERVARERGHVLNGRQVIMPQSGGLENEPQREKCQHSTEASCHGQFPACGTSAWRREEKNAKANGNSEKNAFN